MKEKQYIKNLNPQVKTFLVIMGLIIAGVIFGYIISQFSLQTLIYEIENLPIQIDQSRISRSIDYYVGAVIILTIELVLLIGVLYVYLDSYKNIKSRYLIVLNLFIIALVVKSALSIISLHNVAIEYIQVIPYVSRTFLTPGFSILNFVITGIEIIAMSILVYIGME